MPAISNACDFCTLGQGVSPYLHAGDKGITLGVTSMEMSSTYDQNRAVESNGKKEAWLVYSLTGFYSVMEDLSVMASLSFASKTNIDYDDVALDNPGTLSSGFGDMTLTARYSLYKGHSLENTWKSSLLAGLKLPTGGTEYRDRTGQALDRHAMPGTGSWDFDLGWAGSCETASGFQLTADAVYRISGTGRWAGNDHRYGNMLNYAVRGFHRIAQSEAGMTLSPFVGLSGETNGKERGVKDPGTGNYDSGLENPSSGGTVLYTEVGLSTRLSSTALLNFGFSKALYHWMNFDPAYDADPAEAYKFNLSVTCLF